MFIRSQDKDLAIEEMTAALNREFQESIAEEGFGRVKEALCRLVDEALAPGQEKVMETLPHTIDVLMDTYGKDHQSMKYLARVSGNSRIMVEHTVNVTALVLQFCFFHDIDEISTRQLGVASLLHDVGTARIENTILEKKERLTKDEFRTFSTHPLLGHEMISQHTDFDEIIPCVALEHHERIDGSGYPKKTRQITWEGQIIGLIDSYESLTYRAKTFRKRKTPYDSLSLIKKEVLGGRFSKEIFRQFASCLTR